MRAVRRLLLVFCFGFLAQGMASAPAEAKDVGDIALLEDSDGSVAGAFFPHESAAKLACAFMAEHQDVYDSLIVFSTVPHHPLNASPMGWAIRQTTKGIGRDFGTDQSAASCADKRALKHVVRMGLLSELPDNPDGRYDRIPELHFSGVEVLAHEFGHYWLAAADYAPPGGKQTCLLRGLGSNGKEGMCSGYEVSAFTLHWSFYFANGGSLLYGSNIVELGSGRFEARYAKPHFTPLDQYLMGLRRPADVPPFFVVGKTSSAPSDSARYPVAPGKVALLQGKRRSVTVDDVIRAMGPRKPSSDPCHWTGAFAILHAPGKPPSAQEIAKVEAYRTRWQAFYSWATQGRGSFDATLDRRGKPSCTGQAGPPKADAGLADLGADGAAPGHDGGAVDGGADAAADQGVAEPESDTGGCQIAADAPSAGLLVSLFLLVMGWSRRCRGCRRP